MKKDNGGMQRVFQETNIQTISKVMSHSVL